MQIFVNGEPLPKTRSRKALWLLALLTLRDGKPVGREWTAGMLWPTVDASVALANLRPVVSELRRALGNQGERLLIQNRKTLAIDLDGADVDVVAFDLAVAQGERERAIELYRGPLLEDSAEEWVPQERGAREQACLQAIQTLAEEAAKQGDPTAEAAHYERAVVFAPYRDAPRRGLMEALAKAGDLHGALQVYRDFAQALRQSSGGSPDAQTTELYIRLRSEGPSDRKPSQEPKPIRLTGDLPLPITGLVGREDERLEVEARLREFRLVTLTGLGRIGKTRLAREVATGAADRFPGGVFLIALESLRSPALVERQIASALNVRETPGQELLQTVAEKIRPKRLLLVLDNCEHLLNACAQACDALLRFCPGLRILATSREALGIPGEKVWPVPGLTTPDVAGLPTQGATRLRVLESYESVRLFVERAQAARDGFALSRENADDLAAICEGLEGIPLAIELAAAQVRSLEPRAIADRLKTHRLDFLTRGNRAAAPRQQTLRATLDWSYDLLDPSERTLLARLSVFESGWTFEAAEQVCGSAEHPAADALSTLVDRSLVVFYSGSDGARYRMLETVRSYAREKLTQSGEESEVAKRHRACYLEYAERLGPRLTGREQERGLDAVEDALGNFRAALASSDDPDVALRILGALGQFWYVRGGYAVARRLLDEALSQGGSPSARAPALATAGSLASAHGDYSAARHYATEALMVFREIGNSAGEARALKTIGTTACYEGRHTDARSAYDEEIEILRRIDEPGLAVALGNLAQVLIPSVRRKRRKRAWKRAYAFEEGSATTTASRSASIHKDRSLRPKAIGTPRFSCSRSASRSAVPSATSRESERCWRAWAISRSPKGTLGRHAVTSRRRWPCSGRPRIHAERRTRSTTLAPPTWRRSVCRMRRSGIGSVSRSAETSAIVGSRRTRSMP